MNTFLPAQPVTVAIAVPPGATEYYWRLIDQSETILIPNADPVAIDGQEKLAITVPADKNVLPMIAGPWEQNSLAAPSLRGIRVVEAYFTTPSGLVKSVDEYMIEAEQTLVINVNSFQTYSESVMSSYDVLTIPGWDAASKADRIRALIAARRNIAQLRFRYVFDAYQDRVEATIGVSDLTMVNLQNWLALPVDFKNALKRAQVLEADFLLQGGDNPVDVKRRMGIISETIGESSMFMRSTKPIEQALCKRAMKELAKYILYRVRTTRS